MRTGTLSKIPQLLQARVSWVHWAPLGRVPRAPGHAPGVGEMA